MASNKEAIDLHNAMVLKLSENITAPEFQSLKYRLLEYPLTRVDINELKTVQELFKCLMDETYINFGDYGQLLPKLIEINPSLESTVLHYTKEINKILNPEPEIDDASAVHVESSRNPALKDIKGEDGTVALEDRMASVPVRIKGQTICIDHEGSQLESYCKQCNVLVCAKCIRQKHRRHSLNELCDVTRDKKEDIQNFIDKTEKVDLVHIDQYITSSSENLKENTKIFDDLSQKIKTQTNKLKDELDLMCAHTVSRYKQMEEDNAKLLQTYKQNLEINRAHLKQKVQECKTVIKIGTDVEIYIAGCEIQTHVTLCMKPTLGIASFSPNRDPQQYLNTALGEVEISGKSPESQGDDQSIECSSEHVLSTTTQRLLMQSVQQQSKEGQEMHSPIYTLLPRTKLLEEWKCPLKISSVCPTTGGQTWTYCQPSDVLILLDNKSNVLQEVKHSSRIWDISLSPATNTLWVCDWEHAITELVSERLIHRFQTEEAPECICITASNHVIVGMESKISKFTLKGKLVLSKSATGTVETTVNLPNKVSECPITFNLAVIYNNMNNDRNHQVLVMDAEFKEMFVYDSEIPDTYRRTSQPGRKAFYPSGVVYDSAGNLVIGDYNNNCVLLISGHGEFLKILHTDSYCVDAVGLGKDDVLCTLCMGKNVKLLQYYSVIYPARIFG
ncbi:uncharacterized protein LOC117315749 [Pecten maximus]|uniref:uncharacterized protein LOC117315749 n=1 Tax=Pecten maximus TaxID=6579 RepID=UPI001458AF4E|nr:uncharacterized protein LOC117315749 [Pecten maximus]